MTTDSTRIRLLVLFGGKSAEHDVSVMSATNVMAALDPKKYDAVPVFISRDGRWHLSSFANGVLDRSGNGDEVMLAPGGNGRLLAMTADGISRELAPVDAMFPVLHGLPGEDGSVQGYADVAGVALIGCGIAGSANALDKDLTKRLLSQAGIPNARSVTIHPGAAPAFDELAATLGTPIFIKPARQGSSVGVSKVTGAADYDAALATGFAHDRKLIAEEFIKAREIECAVLEAPDGSLFVSRPGEIAPAEHSGFYTYDAKYIDADGAAIIVPAELPKDVEARLQAMAADAFRAVGCDGMARVDFFVTADMTMMINELNTIPGFTNISMYPKAMAASGVDYPELIERLIIHGLSRKSQHTKI